MPIFKKSEFVTDKHGQPLFSGLILRDTRERRYTEWHIVSDLRCDAESVEIRDCAAWNSGQTEPEYCEVVLYKDVPKDIQELWFEEFYNDEFWKRRLAKEN